MVSGNADNTLKMRIWVWSVMIFFSCTLAMAQKKPASIWATARFNKDKVMVGEPLVVTITVYTSTWFTQPPVFSEIQVSGALMVRLEQRAGAKTVSIGKKKYPAIEQKFVVYPSLIGDNVLPSFEIKTTCPPEGDYKGIERLVRTKERDFKVLPPPEGVETDKWLSSYNVTLTDTWDRPLKDLKAGDVLERRIRIRASGTLAALISPLDLPTVEFGNTYPKTPILGNVQNQGSFTGSRTDIITYLIEKDGTFTIPEVRVPWFSLRDKQQMVASIEPINIEVAPNPDLEFILSRQKALQEELAKEETAEVEVQESFEFLGLNWWQLILVILALMALILQVIRLIKKMRFRMKVKKEKELASEAHYFKELEEACKSGDSKTIIRQLFFWYDRFRVSKFNPEIEDFIKKSEDEDLSRQLGEIAKTTFRQEHWDTPVKEKEDLIKNLSNARKNTEEKKEKKEQDAWMQLNPN